MVRRLFVLQVVLLLHCIGDDWVSRDWFAITKKVLFKVVFYNKIEVLWHSLHPTSLN